MNKIQFREFLSMSIREILPKDCHIEYSEDYFRNDERMYNIVIRLNDSENALVAIPVNPMHDAYDSGVEPTTIVKEFQSTVLSATATLRSYANVPSINEFDLNLDKIREFLTIRVFDRKSNQEYLKNTIKRDIGDFTFAAHLFTSESIGIDLVKDLIPDIGATEEEILEAAFENAAKIEKPELVNITKAVPEEFLWTDSLKDAVLISSEKKENGASVAGYPGIMENLYTQIGEFLLIPMSVHFLIAVPKKGLTTEALEALIDLLRNGNEKNARTDILSEHLFHYSLESGICRL